MSIIYIRYLHLYILFEFEYITMITSKNIRQSDELYNKS